MSKFDKRGRPILTLGKKLDALRYCAELDAPEDVLGHLADLMHYFAERHGFSVQEFIDHEPVPVEVDA